ncbi:MAG TPA: hypothetical protein PK970_08650 [Hyphomicrobiaceae bacterium]|nr:hypothetical protein [Hyphomicrobiaceae bacterium]
MMFHAARKIGAVAATALLLALSQAGSAMAQSAVSNLLGNWSGSGRISYTDGSSEAIRCNAYNTGGGSEVRMAIQCRSEKNPIHIRSQLKIDGGRASGQWEERTFNAAGTASGSASSSNVNLSITGGGLTGAMAVSISRSSLTITITTQGIPMNRATMNLSRQ